MEHNFSGVFVDVVSCVDQTAGQTQGSCFAKLEGVLVPGRQQVVAVSPVVEIGAGPR
jgi:hypothetical protein